MVNRDKDGKVFGTSAPNWKAGILQLIPLAADESSVSALHRISKLFPLFLFFYVRYDPQAVSATILHMTTKMSKLCSFTKCYVSVMKLEVASWSS